MYKIQLSKRGKKLVKIIQTKDNSFVVRIVKYVQNALCKKPCGWMCFRICLDFRKLI